MNLKVKSLIKEHALEETPKEACGFIYTTEKGIFISRCKNISIEPSEEFEIEQGDYFETCKLGTIVGIYHSGSGSAFSPSDIFHADEWPLPLYLYSLEKDSFHIYWPKEYRIDYLGRPFIWGQYDCYTIVKDYYRREYNIFLGEYDADDEFESSGKQDIVANFTKEGFLEGLDMSNINIGDVLLFKCGKEYHVGIYLDNNQFLHQPLHKQSRIELIDGFWAKSLQSVLTHKSRI